MDSRVLDFIKNNRISCLTTMLKDGQPHAAAMHFCHSENPLEFYFLTEKGSRKAAKLPSKASLVIGFDEKHMVTLQLEGDIVIVEGDEQQKALETFHAKFNNDVSKLTEEDIFLKFTPTWWRYTELKADPEVTISSD